MVSVCMGQVYEKSRETDVTIITKGAVWHQIGNLTTDAGYRCAGGTATMQLFAAIHHYCDKAQWTIHLMIRSVLASGPVILLHRRRGIDSVYFPERTGLQAVTSTAITRFDGRLHDAARDQRR